MGNQDNIESFLIKQGWKMIRGYLSDSYFVTVDGGTVDIDTLEAAGYYIDSNYILEPPKMGATGFLGIAIGATLLIGAYKWFRIWRKQQEDKISSDPDSLF